MLLCGTHYKELKGALDHATNNAAELTAAVQGLKALKMPCVVTIISDSQYVVNGGNGTWARKTNVGLWAQLEQAMRPHQVTFEWVRGHAGDTHNERCHALCEEALRTFAPARRPLWEVFGE